jgi:hypothetical protein
MPDFRDLAVDDWFGYLELLRSYLMSGHDALMEVEALIEDAVRHTDSLERHAWALGFDLRILARKVGRPIGHAGTLHLEAAKALRTSEMVLRGALPSPGLKTPKHKHSLVTAAK